MAKKTVALDGLLNTDSRPTKTGFPQRGEIKQPGKAKPSKRDGEKRLTLALDGETYRRLRLLAVETDRTHQAILEDALISYLNNS